MGVPLLLNGRNLPVVHFLFPDYFLPGSPIVVEKAMTAGFRSVAGIQDRHASAARMFRPCAIQDEKPFPAPSVALPPKVAANGRSMISIFVRGLRTATKRLAQRNLQKQLFLNCMADRVAAPDS